VYEVVESAVVDIVVRVGVGVKVAVAHRSMIVTVNVASRLTTEEVRALVIDAR